MANFTFQLEDKHMDFLREFMSTQLDKIENILYGMAKAQRAAKKRPPVNQTIIQVPTSTSRPKANLPRALKMFDD